VACAIEATMSRRPSKILALVSSLADQSGHSSAFFGDMFHQQAPETFAKAAGMFLG
jgi:hypothetical protein